MAFFVPCLLSLTLGIVKNVLRFSFILLLLLSLSCSKDPPLFKLDNLNNNEIGCFGHAGMGSRSLYPVNTFESLESCLNRGADGTEMDVQVTKDSVLVIYHNENLSAATSCSGRIKEMNWSEIQDCKMNSLLFKNLDVMSFDEFIQKIPNPKDYIFTWDCKLWIDDFNADNNEYFRFFARTLIRTMDAYDLGQNIFIENPVIGFLLIAKEMRPSLKLFYLAETYEGGLEQAVQWKFYGISMHHTKLTAEQIKTAHENNLHVTLFGVLSEKENYSAVEKSPDFMQTDNINYLLKIFGKYNKGKGYLFSMSH